MCTAAMHRNKISTWPNLCGIGFPTEYQGVATKLALGLGLMKQKVDSYYLHVIFNEIATLFFDLAKNFGDRFSYQIPRFCDQVSL